MYELRVRIKFHRAKLNEDNYMTAKLQAHRGVSTDYPENTLAAFNAAADEGYAIVECDPKYTADGEIVMHHDRTIARTGRTADGNHAPDKNVSDLTFSELRALDFGIWKSEKFRGEKAPTLRETLEFAEQRNMPIKIDNVWQSFPESMKEKLFRKARESRADVAFTSNTVESVRYVAAHTDRGAIHYDGDLSEETLKAVKAASGERELYVWVCYDNELTGWFKGEKANPEVCARAKRYGKLGVWILSRDDERETAETFGAEIIETTGSLKP